jgi:LacI family transcriptional regulator
MRIADLQPIYPENFFCEYILIFETHPRNDDDLTKTQNISIIVVSATGNANNGYMTDRVTISDVARRAGVSLMTVSRVVNNKEDVSPSTRQRVLEVIEELGYRPSSIARGLVTHRTCTLGVVVPDIDNPFFSGLVRGAEDMAYNEGYSVLLCNTNEDPERELAVLHSLEEKQIDGLLLCSSRLSDDELYKVIVRFPAVVLAFRKLDDACVGAALIDETAGGRIVAEHLFGTGHKSIGLIFGPSISFSAIGRLQGFREALTEAELPYQREWLRRCLPTLEEGYKAAKNLLLDHPQLTALVCHNDLVAISALQACAELDLRVPEDIAIVGYDDIPMAALVTPSLTTCHIPRYELGTDAMRLLLDQIADGDGNPQDILIQPNLKVRDSAPDIQRGESPP